jgi:Leucine-rich repeat (LRR) protein
LTREKNFENILYLNFHDNNIEKIEGIVGLPALSTLVLSFNKIQEICGLEECTSLR